MASTGTRSNDSIVRATIFECLALADGKKKSDAYLYKNQWGKTAVAFNEHQRFLDMFGYSLTVWRVASGKEHSAGELIFGTEESNSLNVSVGKQWMADSEEISCSDSTSWIKNPEILNYALCTETDCDFVARNKTAMDEHIAAHVKDRIHCVSEKTGCKAFIRDDMISEGILPPGFRVKQFVTWDIESLLVKSDIGHTHTPFAIAATRNFGVDREWFFSRKDSSAKALREMIVAFLNWLERCAVEYISELPDLDDSLKQLYIHLKRHREGLATMCPKELAKTQQFVQELKSLQLLQIMSFNGENYDIPVLKAVLPNMLYYAYVTVSTFS